LEMLKEGASIDFIAKVTQLSRESIENLQKVNSNRLNATRILDSQYNL